VANLLNEFSMRQKYQALFSSPLGDEVLTHICKQGFVTRSTFTKNEQQETMLNEGSRRLALSILKFAKNQNDTKELLERTI